ncbi:MAG: Thermostable beta-glucosidase, partial [Chloroflexota bacterium]
FAYGDITVAPESDAAADDVQLTIPITNTGTVAGAEVVQLYIHAQASRVFRATHELKGYAKVFLQPDESHTVSFRLPRRAFAHYDVPQARWVVEAGVYDIQIGASSRDIRQQVSVTVASADVVSATPDIPALQAYWKPSATGFSAAAFRALWGGHVPSSAKRRGQFTANTPIADMHESALGRKIHAQLRAGLASFTSNDPDGPTNKLFAAMAEEAPLRILLMFGAGKVSTTSLQAMVAWINRDYLGALRWFVKGIFTPKA